MSDTRQNPLTELTIEITRECPLSCLHCSVFAQHFSQEHLNKVDIKQIIRDFQELGGKELAISGGEPFLHPKLYEIIKFAKDKGLVVHIFSCGVFNRRKASKKSHLGKAKRLRRLNVDKVFVSLHGSNAEIHDGISDVSGSFEKATQFIRALVSEGLHVCVNYVPMKPNFEEFPDLVDFAQESLGVKEVSVLRFVPQGRGKLNEEWLALSKEESARFIEILTNAMQRRDIEVSVGAHLDFRFLLDASCSPKKCNAGISKCLIKANGDVLPCSAFKELPRYVAGNIKKTTLKQLWTGSPIFEQFRKFDEKRLSGTCKKCPHLSKCRGRCIAQRIQKLKRFYGGPDPYCPRGFE